MSKAKQYLYYEEGYDQAQTNPAVSTNAAPKESNAKLAEGIPSEGTQDQDALTAAIIVGDMHEALREQAAAAALEVGQILIDRDSAANTPLDLHAPLTEDLLQRPYVPTMNKVLETDAIKSRFTPEEDATLAQKLITLTDENLKSIAELLMTPELQGTDQLLNLKIAYGKDIKDFADAVAQISNDTGESALVNAELAESSAISVIQNAETYDIAFAWVVEVMRLIDGDDYTSPHLDSIRAAFSEGAKRGLKEKLWEERAKGLAKEGFVRKCLQLAQLFRGEGSDIDDALIDPKFAQMLLKEALDWEGMAIRFMEKRDDLKKPLADAVSENKEAVRTQLDAFVNFNGEKEGVMEWVNEVLAVLETPAESTEDLATQYALIESLKNTLNQQAMPSAGELASALSELILTNIEVSIKAFQDFIGTIGGDANTITQALTQATGMNFSSDQKEALRLLLESEGNGLGNLSDENELRAKMFAKIAGTVLIGIVFGVALSAAGLSTGALVLAEASLGTATGAIADPKSFSTPKEAADYYLLAFGAELLTGSISDRVANVMDLSTQLTLAGKSTENISDLMRLAFSDEQEFTRVFNALIDQNDLGVQMAGKTVGSAMKTGTSGAAEYARASLTGEDKSVESIILEEALRNGLTLGADLASQIPSLKMAGQELGDIWDELERPASPWDPAAAAARIQEEGLDSALLALRGGYAGYDLSPRALAFVAALEKRYPGIKIEHAHTPLEYMNGGTPDTIRSPGLIFTEFPSTGGLPVSPGRFLDYLAARPERYSEALPVVGIASDASTKWFKGGPPLNPEAEIANELGNLNLHRIWAPRRDGMLASFEDFLESLEAGTLDIGSQK